ncbi:MAG: GNAT family N-acetyltransferase [Bacilli bacterium]|nr:GNAT family N-acetyltransferase [Bacilli bacterium]MBN2876372.1 GNAT family N-acetyltransferase [Bacilli bacterium]
MAVHVRKAKREDSGLILDLIKGIAEYEKLSDQVEATVSLLEQQLFDEKNAFVLLAFHDEIAVGFALYFYNFSTFKGKKGLYLEDLFVKPEYRGLGIGNMLFETLRDIARQENCGRMEWVCLDWNQPAIDFYRKKNARSMDDWIIFRLNEDDL